MKRVFVLISLVLAILVIGGNAFAHIPEPSLSSEWKLVFTRSDGSTYYVNTKKITYLPEGIVEVPTLEVTRGETRENLVNTLKKPLTAEGKDPNNAERLWYIKSLMKINCRAHQFTPLEISFYSFGKAVLFSYSVQHEEWRDISPGSPAEGVGKFVCNEAPASIPDPSLSSNWNLVARASDGTTFYVDKRSVIYLPGGIVKVWQLLVPRGEFRRTLVNHLKKILFFEGKDQKNAERLWYIKSLYKFNCKTHQSAQLELIGYSFGQAVLVHISSQHEKWGNDAPGSPGERIEKYMCK